MKLNSLGKKASLFLRGGWPVALTVGTFAVVNDFKHLVVDRDASVFWGTIMLVATVLLAGAMCAGTTFFYMHKHVVQPLTEALRIRMENERPSVRIYGPHSSGPPVVSLVKTPDGSWKPAREQD